MNEFVWLGGRPSLDLCNTLSVDGNELFEEPGDIGRWLTQAGLGAPEQGPVDDDLRLIRALRSELRAAFVAHDPMTIAELVGEWLSATPGRLTIDRASLRPNFCPEISTCRCLLVPVLLDAIDLARDDIGRVRVCAADSCQIVYLDASRNRSRRWCSMERCGSRAKAHAYYNRHRGTRVDVGGQAER